MLAEVGPARGHLARRADQRDRALGSQTARVELRRRAARQPGRRGRGSQRAARAPAPVAPHDPALDAGRAARLDQLLADGPGERLERLRAPARTQPRLAADHRPDQRVPAEAAMELARDRDRRQGRTASARCPSVQRPATRASARIRTAEPAAQARTTTCSSPIHSARVSAPSRRDHAPRPVPGPEACTGRRGRRPARAWRLSVLEEVDVDEEGARRGHVDLLAAAAAAARGATRRRRGRLRTRTRRNVATPIRKPPVAAATAAGSETSTRRSMGRGSASTGSVRTSAPARYREGAGSGTSRRLPRQRARSYTRYFFTISPPIASMARFMALLVSRIQPISPPLTRVTSAMSKCSAYRPAATPVC